MSITEKENILINNGFVKTVFGYEYMGLCIIPIENDKDEFRFFANTAIINSGFIQILKDNIIKDLHS